jgi:hypothetical protein
MTDEAGTAAREGFTPDDLAAHPEHDHLAAVFADRNEATAAVEELRSLGLGSDHLGVAVHGDDAVVFEHDADAELVRDAEVGVAVGAPTGAIAGLALAALTLPGAGVIVAGGMLAIAGASTLWGTLLGGYFGLATGEPGLDTHAAIAEKALEEGEILVVVCSHGHPDAVRDVMERHGGRWRVVEAETT